MPKPSKVTYIFGAGFSADARFPLQRAILGQLMDLNFADFPDKLLDQFLSQANKVTLFLRRAFDVTESLDAARTRPLEEIFTLLDQCISDNANFAGFTTPQLMSIREAFIRLILFLLFRHSKHITPERSKSYNAIAAFLIKERLGATKKGDPFAVISLNWDTLLEDSIFNCIRSMRAGRKIDVDFCFYTTPLNKRLSIHTPSPKQKARRIYNIKVLKMHGSSNWLRCPVSNLVYTGLGMKIDNYDLYISQRESPLAVERPVGSESGNLPMLEPYIITPTFLKEFSLPHIQTTWHNAFVELRESDRIVFVGYSMPEADYHFRALLRRAILPKIPIEVVLTQNDNPRGIKPKYRWTSAATRYRQFFGEKNVTFHYDGVQGYFKRLTRGHRLNILLKECTRILKK